MILGMNGKPLGLDGKVIGIETCTVTTANAGENFNAGGSDFQYVFNLDANTPTCGTGEWSEQVPGQGTFSDVNDPNATYTVIFEMSEEFVVHAYKLTWTITAESGQSSDTVTLTYLYTPL